LVTIFLQASFQFRECVTLNYVFRPSERVSCKRVCVLHLLRQMAEENDQTMCTSLFRQLQDHRNVIFHFNPLCHISSYIYYVPSSGRQMKPCILLFLCCSLV